MEISKNNTGSIKEIATDFYAGLFDTKTTDSKKAQKLLRNIKPKNYSRTKNDLEENITLEN